ncbi:MAG: YesL family protein [Christensenellales bacterium]
MFGKFMNSYYYGKSGKGDYRKDDLPKTRWQLFFEMLRVRFAGLFRLNLMTMIAWIPMMYVLSQLVTGLFNLAGVISQVELDRAAATADQLAVYEQQLPLLNNMVFMALLYLIPCIALTGPFQAGMAYVTRNWARDEHAFAWGDFKDAFLANWKQALGVSLISGLIPLILYVGYRFYGQMSADSVFFVVPQMLTLLLGLIWALALSYLYPMMVTYKMGFLTLIKNSLLLAVGRLPQTAAARLIMLVPALVVVAIGWFMTPYALYALMVLALYYILVGNALARFVYASLSNAVFDRFINPNIEGAQVDRGLAKEEDDEEEEEEETSPEALSGGKDKQG